MTRYFSLFLSLFCACYSVTAQNIDSLLLVQRAADPQEKTYVHFDKNYYNPGETIWFKAYLFTGTEPSEVSKNFYAELVDEQGHVISQKTAPIAFAGASGSIDLDSSLQKPLLYFRGYTISQLNSDTSFLYSKAIRIITSKTTTGKATASTKPPVLRFLPEGGDWVAGLPSTIAFIASNQQEQPVTITGFIADNDGERVAELTTLHNGMGLVKMIPQEGRSYTATWKDENGKQYSTALPPAKAQGVSLQVKEENGNRRFTLYRSPEVPAGMKKLHVIAYMNQQMAFKADVNMAARVMASGVFPTADLPSGILQITVFDSSYQPVAERITFINNRNHEFDGDAYFLQKNFGKRAQNEIEIVISDTLPANLSISITDAALNESNKMDDNIVSRLLLTSELRGKIKDPYYYFYSNSDSVSIHLDLVMLTHGWRRYNWQQVMAGKVPVAKWKESNYLSIDGKVNGLLPGSISPDLQLTGILLTADSAKNFINLPVDRNGRVFSDGLVFYDNAKLYFNFNKKSLSFDKSMLLLDNGLRKGFNRIVPDTTLKLGLPQISTATLTNNRQVNRQALQASRQLANARVMENITIRATAKTAKEQMEEKYVSGLFSGDGNSFDLVNDPLAGSYLDIFQYLQGKVAGLQITTGGAEPILSWRGGRPALYLNEMETSADMLSSTPVSDIAYIKVLRPGSSIVRGGGGGVIAVYTRKGGDSRPDPNVKGLSHVQLMGYSPVKEFYSPDYASFAEQHSYDDVRTTLYWNPTVILDKTRKRLRIKFYNNDITKRFRLVMEGINVYGKLIHVEKEIGE